MVKVEDIMAKDVISVKRSTSLKDMLGRFKNFHTFPVVPVVDDADALCGIVRLDNIIDIFRPAPSKILKTIPFIDTMEENLFDAELTPYMGILILVEDIMEDKFITLPNDMDIQKAYSKLKRHGRKQLPVVGQDNKLVGIIGTFDIVWHIFHNSGVV